jgi:hypothetical protein
MPATAVALLAFLAVLVPTTESRVETSLEDSGAFTYHNFTAGTTLVWLSYPAESEGTDTEDQDALE